MTTRTATRLFVVLVAALAIALLGVEGDAAAVKKQESENGRSGLAKTAHGKTQQARKGKKRRGRATKKRGKKKKPGKKPEKKADEPVEETDEVEAEAPALESPPTEPAPATNGGKLRKTAGSGLEPKPTLGTEGVPMNAGTGLRQSNRMEFDARVVRGETAGSGAVILFERGPRDLAPLTKKRTRFLDETIEGVLGKEEAIAAREKRARALKRKASKEDKKSDEKPEKKADEKSDKAEKSDKSDKSDKSEKNDKNGKNGKGK